MATQYRGKGGAGQAASRKRYLRASRPRRRAPSPQHIRYEQASTHNSVFDPVKKSDQRTHPCARLDKARPNRRRTTLHPRYVPLLRWGGWALAWASLHRHRGQSAKAVPLRMTEGRWRATGPNARVVCWRTQKGGLSKRPDPGATPKSDTCNPASIQHVHICNDTLGRFHTR